MTARAWLWLLLALLVAAGGGFTFLRCEGSPPVLRAPERIALGRAGSTLTIAASDPDSGMRSLSAKLVHAGGEIPLGEVVADGSLLRGAADRSAELALEVGMVPKELGLKEGDAVLAIEARDWSWRDAFSGNAAVLEIPVSVDLTPPRIAVESGLTYVRRAGSNAVRYRLDAPAARDGVRVGDAFYTGFPLPGSSDPLERIALFAIPRDAPADVQVKVEAEDEAGNRASAGWMVRLMERGFAEADLNLPHSFFDGKVVELADELEIPASDPVAAFQVINRDVRAANEAQIREIVAASGPELRFHGPFRQLSNSKVTSLFAEHRKYFLDGQQISEAIHYGYDLASLANSPIEASNAGRVLYAGPLGIYGGCVILDHGLGLTSLYGHLSRIDVKVGEDVKQGQTLGISGSTGLAGGDHLHFAMLVGDTYVDPVEWWDPKWIHDHFEAELQLAP